MREKTRCKRKVWMQSAAFPHSTKKHVEYTGQITGQSVKYGQTDRRWAVHRLTSRNRAAFFPPRARLLTAPALCLRVVLYIMYIILYIGCYMLCRLLSSFPTAPAYA